MQGAISIVFLIFLFLVGLTMVTAAPYRYYNMDTLTLREVSSGSGDADVVSLTAALSGADSLVLGKTFKGNLAQTAREVANEWMQGTSQLVVGTTYRFNGRPPTSDLDDFLQQTSGVTGNPAALATFGSLFMLPFAVLFIVWCLPRNMSRSIRRALSRSPFYACLRTSHGEAMDTARAKLDDA